jgi:hypothetical protein
MESPFSISKLTLEGISLGLFFYTSTISPGLVYFYMFHRDFFISTDWIKLVLLSSGLMLPFLIINTFSFASLEAAQKKDDEDDIPMKYLKGALPIGAWITLLSFYFSFALCYILGDFNPMIVFIFVSAAHGFIFILFMVRIVRQKKKNEVTETIAEKS